ncbi:hypothetical protein GCM10008941_33180 [Rhizomicrobium palustre]
MPRTWTGGGEKLSELSAVSDCFSKAIYVAPKSHLVDVGSADRFEKGEREKKWQLRQAQPKLAVM